MEWHHTMSPKSKTIKAKKSVGKIIATILWDAQGIIVVKFYLGEKHQL